MEQTSLCEVIEYEISKLPSLDDLIARLVVIETKQMTLMTAISDNAGEIGDFNTTLDGPNGNDGLLNVVNTLETNAITLDN